MAIVLRSVKGSNLTPGEVDGNFEDLDGRLTDMENDPPTGVGVTGFSVSGQTFTVNLSNGSTFGPYALPVAAIRWAGNYVASTTYDPLDMFFVPGYGLYLVLSEYEAPTEFDPAVEDTEGPVLQAIMGASIPVPVETFTDDHTMVSTDLGGYVRMNKATAVLFSVPLESVVPVDVGTVVTIRQVGAGQVAIDPLDTGITINTPETLLTRKQGATVTLINVGPDEWDLSGDLEPA